MGGLKLQQLILLVWKSEVQYQISAKLVYSGSSEGGTGLCFPPGFLWSLEILGNPWFVNTSFPSLPLSSQGLLLPMCLLFLEGHVSLDYCSVGKLSMMSPPDR